MQVKIPVLAPVLRLTILLILADTGEVANHNRPNPLINTPFNNVF